VNDTDRITLVLREVRCHPARFYDVARSCTLQLSGAADRPFAEPEQATAYLNGSE
jgi:hypothetical protein